MFSINKLSLPDWQGCAKQIILLLWFKTSKFTMIYHCSSNSTKKYTLMFLLRWFKLVWLLIQKVGLCYFSIDIALFQGWITNSDQIFINYLDGIKNLSLKIVLAHLLSCCSLGLINMMILEKECYISNNLYDLTLNVTDGL